MLTIRDRCFDGDLVRAAAAAWPAIDWPHWLLYDSPFEVGKRVCEDWETIPPACALLLGRMLALPELAARGLTADPSIRGGGMQSMTHGGRLDVHHDSSHHSVYGWARRVNAILFLNDGWREEWGGAFELWSPDLSGRSLSVLPASGRLLLFETNDGTPHGVPRPLRCPPDVQRMTLACWWYAHAGASYRARAGFQRLPGERDDADIAAARRHRGS